MMFCRNPLLAVLIWICATQVCAAEPGGAIRSLETLAQQGDAQAQTQLAIKYEHAEGVPRDYSKALALYCQAARQGTAAAQFNLGWMYANGRGVAKDDVVAAALLRLAAAQGHSPAQRLISYMAQSTQAKLPPCLSADEEPSPLENLRLISAERRQIEALVYKLAPQYSVDPRLVLAVITVESSFQVTAKSPKNAQGLMQLIPATAQRFHVKNVYDASENIKGGLAYLQWLLAFFKGDTSLVAAAYNAGEGAVEKYRGVPPYPETKSYVQKIAKLYKKSSHPYLAHIVEPSRRMQGPEAAANN